LDKTKLIVYSLTTTYPDSQSSTKAKFVHILNKELVKLGISVKVICPHSKGSITTDTMDSVFIKRFRYLPANYEINQTSIAEEIRYSKFGKLKIFIMTLSFFIVTIFECLKEKPDIIHAHWAFPGGYLASIVSKIIGTKYVVSIHGGEIPLLKKFKFLQNRVINSLNNSSKVIVNSSYSEDEMIKFGVKKEKIVKINPAPNFVKHSSDKVSLQKFRNRFADDNVKIILYYGRLTERKGVEYVLRAIPEINTKSVHLIIVGGGEQLENLKKITNSLELGNKVTFFGRASDDELGSLHDISDVFVCPSIIDSKGETEALGLVIPEAMESGLPVIASSVGGIVDIIKHEDNGLLVMQKDSKEIAIAIDRILSDKEFANKLVLNSKKMVVEFQPNKIAERHFQLFQKILSN